MFFFRFYSYKKADVVKRIFHEHFCYIKKTNPFLSLAQCQLLNVL